MKKLILCVVILIQLFLVASCKRNCAKSDKCYLKPDAGNCQAAIPKYYYNKWKNKAEQFVWGGCGGVVPFDTKEECESQCVCK
ncbi:MAG TPA: BPTI/Kunitz domain-containing protein [Chitinophagaceae bacterium]|nr:BPTI/Kunitz domain-containing protein [Chitinophagaceae bacterium]